MDKDWDVILWSKPCPVCGYFMCVCDGEDEYFCKELEKDYRLFIMTQGLGRPPSAYVYNHGTSWNYVCPLHQTVPCSHWCKKHSCFHNLCCVNETCDDL